jgi:hypothetical protein
VLDDTSPPADTQHLPAGHQASVDVAAAAANGVNSDHQLWSDIVSKRHRHHRVHSFKQSVVTALYADQSLKRSRENSFIVTGLAPTPTRTDMELFANMCVAEFQLQPDVVSVKRLGQPQAGRAQPLLVYLKQAARSKRLTDAAKQLRRSSDPAVRGQVFINPNPTKAKAAAAYQVRVQRRLALQRQRESGNRGQPSSVQALCRTIAQLSIDWSTDSSLPTSNVTCTGIFLEFYYTHGLRQLVCKPTRGERILDLVLSNDICSVLNYRILEPFSTSDHSQVSFDLPHKVSTNDYIFNTCDFHFADWSSVKS